MDEVKCILIHYSNWSNANISLSKHIIRSTNSVTPSTFPLLYALNKMQCRAFPANSTTQPTRLAAGAPCARRINGPCKRHRSANGTRRHNPEKKAKVHKPRQIIKKENEEVTPSHPKPSKIPISITKSTPIHSFLTPRYLSSHSKCHPASSSPATWSAPRMPAPSHSHSPTATAL